MTFIKKIKKALTGQKTEESPLPPVETPHRDNIKTYDDLDTDQQWDTLEELLAPLSEKFQGRFIRKNEEEELALNLVHEGMNARIQVDVSDPEAEVFMKFENKRGTLRLYFDPDYKEDEGEDDWSENEEKVHFLSPGIYFEEFPEDFETMKKLTDSLSPGYKNDLAAAMKSLDIGYLKIDAAIIEADVDTNIPDLKDAPGHFEKVFSIMKKTAQVFSEGEKEIEKLASVYIGGKAVRPGEQFVTCSYCSSTVIIGSDARCPNCGGTVKT